ncbi:MAG TPA: hypothetical protein VL550_09300 [Rhodocyclaceae bacterium]|jgi:hypothetical protein|nr:hypothetical protein [Rhodocyclaceae bacterium]
MSTAKAGADKEELKAIAVANTVRARQAMLPLLQAYIEQFQTLRQRGLIGPEQRAAWNDRMRTLRRTYIPSKIDYQFQSQQALPGYSHFAYSTMQLHLQLLHEGDLIAMLDALEKTPSAHLRIRSCTLQRVLPNNEALTPTLQAECMMEWITVPGGMANT